ncbi:MAG TPA: YciI family protein [Streptosporangiaceae bacterium]|jgi:hypothetical protein|nr:YciI family protein [Streptosporangiaceae bacterium]
MTQYLLAVYPYQTGSGTEVDLTEEQLQQSYQDVDALNSELQQAKVWVFAGGLEAATTATVVRSSGGQVVTTDGPFAETKEQIGGFWIIEVPDLDVALEWAGKATVACGAPVEVRPFQAN